jgi:putative ABC transport system permease protein
MSRRLALAGRFAAQQLRSAAVNACLAIAMLAIGAGTITFVLSLGAMAAAEATRSLAALGPSVASVLLASSDGRQPRQPDPSLDPAVVARALGIDEVAALGIAYAQLRAGARPAPTAVIAFEGPVDQLLGLTLATGRWPSIGERESRDCVAGATLAARQPPSGVLLLGDRPCRIVGALAPAPRHSLLPVDVDSSILIARSTASRLDLDAPVRQLLLRIPVGAEEAEIRSLLRRYAASAWPWAGLTLRSSGELIAAMREQHMRQAQLYAAVAGVAVAVAMIGLCAMMLAQVRARRRELGVRLAIGALPGDIVLQILAEALLIGLIAGLLGNLGALVLLGIVASVSGLPVLFDPLTAAATTLGTLLAGTLAGIVPASVAALTDPVYSIRT